MNYDMTLIIFFITFITLTFFSYFLIQHGYPKIRKPSKYADPEGISDQIKKKEYEILQWLYKQNEKGLLKWFWDPTENQFVTNINGLEIKIGKSNTPRFPGIK